MMYAPMSATMNLYVCTAYRQFKSSCSHIYHEEIKIESVKIDRLIVILHEAMQISDVVMNLLVFDWLGPNIRLPKCLAGIRVCGSASAESRSASPCNGSIKINFRVLLRVCSYIMGC